jgi:phage terminase large subunit-like protein
VELTTELLTEIGPSECDLFLNDFSAFAHNHQLPPDFSKNGEPWTTWLILGGRGSGKTRAGAEWVRATAISDPKARIALLGETERDTREVMVEGISGLLAVHPPHERPLWVPSRRRLEWPNGALAQAFSAEEPESLRGPQFSAAWCDELAKWRHAEATFDMLQFGLRLGERPRQVITTTPRPTALLKRLIADPLTCRHTSDRMQPGAKLYREHTLAVWRHASRAAGDRRRNHRATRGRAVVTRTVGALPHRQGATSRAHRCCS